VKGYINNQGDKLRGGQFVRAIVELPPPKGVVEIPISAVIDDGQQSIVFVESNAEKHEYTMRRVQLTRRFENRVFARSTPFDRSEEITAAEAEVGMLPRQPLVQGERLLATGVGELKAALLDRESQPRRQTDSKP